MQLDLSEDQIQIRDAVRELCRGEFATHAAEWDRTDDIPRWAVDKLAEMGLLGMSIPEAHGGLGYDLRTTTIVIEEIARVSAALAILFAVHNSVGAYPIYEFGTDEQRKRWLPRLTSTDMGVFSLSEPASGSDAGALQATAVRHPEVFGQRILTCLSAARRGWRRAEISAIVSPQVSLKRQESTTGGQPP